MDEVLLSSKSDEWPTPQDFYERLHAEFRFTLDPCCNRENAKCGKFYTMEDNGLLMDWGEHRVFMNPPYSEVAAWMAKAYGSARDGATVVCLVPSRTDTQWFHDYAMKGEIRFVRGRLKFGGAKDAAPFPSMVVIFRPTEFKLEVMNA